MSAHMMRNGRFDGDRHGRGRRKGRAGRHEYLQHTISLDQDLTARSNDHEELDEPMICYDVI